MTLSTASYKGARDFYPEDKRLQNYMFNKMREVCERYGYEEYDAPILEPTELFLAKGNQEIIDEQTYSFTDRGGRAVTVRTEMTPSVSRMVAGRRQELAYPLRWYSIPELWRYERMQRGRLRQFWQLNADLFGVEGIAAEHEMIVLADAIMKEFGATTSMYSIRINSRELTKYLFTQYLGLSEAQETALMRLIDRKTKMETEAFWAAVQNVLDPYHQAAGTLDAIKGLLEVRVLNDLPTEVQLQPIVQDLIKLDSMLKDSGVAGVRFDINLVRGFDYYTGVVFEVFDEDPENNRAMFGGGRYDGLVGLFGVEPVPTIGFGMGDVTLQNFLVSHSLLPKLRAETDLYVILLGDDTYEQSAGIMAKLRQEGVSVAVDSSGRKFDKQIRSADKKGISFVMVIGENELASGQFTLKNLATGKTETHGIDRIASLVLAARSHLSSSS